MGKSTPINQLRQEQDNTELVQNILADMENQPNQMEEQQMSQQAPQQQQQQQQEQFDQDYEDEYEGYEDYGPMVQQKPMTATEQIIDEVKLPLLVVLLVFLTNFGQINQLIVQNVPRLASGGELNILGIAVKALVAGVVFYVVKRFLL